MKSIILLVAIGVLTGCASVDVDNAVVVDRHVRHQYVINVKPSIALHRVYNDDKHTYLEFLDTYRMNPVVTTHDGTPIAFSWNENMIVLDGIYDNLTVTTPHGVAHVYAKQTPPPARVSAPAPPRALEYGTTPDAVVFPKLDNYGLTPEIPAAGEAVAPETFSVLLSGTFPASLGKSDAEKLVFAAREARQITIRASIYKRKTTELTARLRVAEARQFLIDNGVSTDKIKTSRSVPNSNQENQVDFIITY